MAIIIKFMTLLQDYLHCFRAPLELITAEQEEVGLDFRGYRDFEFYGAAIKLKFD